MSFLQIACELHCLSNRHIFVIFNSHDARESSGWIYLSPSSNLQCWLQLGYLLLVASLSISTLSLFFFFFNVDWYFSVGLIFASSFVGFFFFSKNYFIAWRKLIHKIKGTKKKIYITMNGRTKGYTTGTYLK